MGVFNDLWKRLASGATRKAAKAATRQAADKVGQAADKVGELAEGALDDAEAILAERQKELEERDDGIVLPSTQVDDPDWLKNVQDAEAAHQKRGKVPEESPQSSPDDSPPKGPTGPTAEDRARARLAQMKKELADSKE